MRGSNSTSNVTGISNNVSTSNDDSSDIRMGPYGKSAAELVLAADIAVVRKDYRAACELYELAICRDGSVEDLVYMNMAYAQTKVGEGSNARWQRLLQQPVHPAIASFSALTETHYHGGARCPTMKMCGLAVWRCTSRLCLHLVATGALSSVGSAGSTTRLGSTTAATTSATTTTTATSRSVASVVASGDVDTPMPDAQSEKEEEEDWATKAVHSLSAYLRRGELRSTVIAGAVSHSSVQSDSLNGARDNHHRQQQQQHDGHVRVCERGCCIGRTRCLLAQSARLIVAVCRLCSDSSPPQPRWPGCSGLGLESSPSFPWDSSTSTVCLLKPRAPGLGPAPSTLAELAKLTTAETVGLAATSLSTPTTTATTTATTTTSTPPPSPSTTTTTAAATNAHIGDLPVEVLDVIAGFGCVSARDLTRLAAVCRRFREVVACHSAWLGVTRQLGLNKQSRFARSVAALPGVQRGAVARAMVLEHLSFADDMSTAAFAEFSGVKGNKLFFERLDVSDSDLVCGVVAKEEGGSVAQGLWFVAHTDAVSVYSPPPRLVLVFTNEAGDNASEEEERSSRGECDYCSGPPSLANHIFASSVRSNVAGEPPRSIEWCLVRDDKASGARSRSCSRSRESSPVRGRRHSRRHSSHRSRGRSRSRSRYHRESGGGGGDDDGGGGCGGGGFGECCDSEIPRGSRSRSTRSPLARSRSRFRRRRRHRRRERSREHGRDRDRRRDRSRRRPRSRSRSRSRSPPRRPRSRSRSRSPPRRPRSRSPPPRNNSSSGGNSKNIVRRYGTATAYANAQAGIAVPNTVAVSQRRSRFKRRGSGRGRACSSGRARDRDYDDARDTGRARRGLYGSSGGARLPKRRGAVWDSPTDDSRLRNVLDVRIARRSLSAPSLTWTSLCMRFERVTDLPGLGPGVDLPADTAFPPAFHSLLGQLVMEAASREGFTPRRQPGPLHPYSLVARADAMSCTTMVPRSGMGWMYVPAVPATRRSEGRGGCGESGPPDFGLALARRCNTICYGPTVKHRFCPLYTSNAFVLGGV